MRSEALAAMIAVAIVLSGALIAWMLVESWFTLRALEFVSLAGYGVSLFGFISALGWSVAKELWLEA